MAWGDLNPALMNRNPLTGLALPPNPPTRMLYGRVAGHIDLLKGVEKQLFETLGVSTTGLNGCHVSIGSFRFFLNDRGPSWMSRETHNNQFLFDDLWQMHAALQGAQSCLDLWQRAFSGIDSTMTVPKPRTLSGYLDWIQEIFDTRTQLAQKSLSESTHGGEAVKKFYDGSRRTALNMRQGADAVFHHLGKPA